MRMDKIEEKLCNWAEKRKFIVCDRIFNYQLQQEYEAGDEISKFSLSGNNRVAGKSVSNYILGIRKKYDAMDDFIRYIYFPTGIVSYSFKQNDKNSLKLSSDSDVERFLEEGFPYMAGIDWKLGERIKNWNNPHCTMQERLDNGKLEGHIKWESNTSIATIGSIHPNLSSDAQQRYGRNIFYRAMFLSPTLMDRNNSLDGIRNSNDIDNELLILLRFLTRMDYLSNHPSQISLLDFPEYYKDEFSEEDNSAR